jgi:hypothetical protein
MVGGVRVARPQVARVSIVSLEAAICCLIPSATDCELHLLAREESGR